MKVDERERTFEDSGLGGGWPWREGTLSARAMAEAGMVWWPWEGEDGRGRVVCVWCSGIEEGWREGDDPMEAHARSTPPTHFGRSTPRMLLPLREGHGFSLS